MKYLMGLILLGILSVGIFTGLQAQRVVQVENGRQNQVTVMLDEIGKVR